MNQSKKPARAILLAAVAAFTVSLHTQAQYYVAPNGTLSNPGTLSAPFLTLAQAQTAMRGSGVKTTYVRAGTYHLTQSLLLLAADNGETWQFYPLDLVDTAILDGGSTGPNTGINPITIDGGSNITINGFVVQNHLSWGIGIYGGAARSGFGDTTTADHDAILNNIVQNGWTTVGHGWGGGGIWADGQVTNLAVKNNVTQNQYGSGIRIGSNGGGSTPNDTIAGYDFENNVVLNTNINTGDNGAIYTQDQNFGAMDPAGSPRGIIKNNFIRDYQGTNGIGNNSPRDVAIYYDRGSSNADIIGNIIAPTANAITTGTGSSQAFFIGSGHSLTFSGNIIDLGSTSYVLNMAYEQYQAGDVMSNNVFSGNIFIGNWAGTQHSGYFGFTNIAYAGGQAGTAVKPTCTNNVYHNYGGGSMATNGHLFNDAAPVSEEPGIFSPTYQVTAGSAVFNAPVNFSPIAGKWGPPLYVIPQTGTGPSCGLFWEAETLAATKNPAGITLRIGTDTLQSAGAGSYFDATAASQYVTYDLPNIAAGTYDVRIGTKGANNKGKWQLAISRWDGTGSTTNIGPTVDEYSVNPVYSYVDLGTWAPGSTSDKAFRFTVTGKNAASSGYGISIDYIELIPQP